MKAYFILFISLLSFGVGKTQTLSSNWEGELESLLADFQSCMQQSNDLNCKSTIGKSMNTLYNLKDFYSSNSNRYATAFEIANEIDNKTTWKKLGQAYEQESLEEAQKLANKKLPVIAVYKDEEGTAAHVVLILPGELIPSGSWGLQVPRVASFFTHQPEKSFIDKSLAYAFSKTMLLRIELYARN
ncbi:MAG: hypothetical protein AAF843_14725 [Bacteroidota bacterium]